MTESGWNEELGHALRERRRRRGLSQEMVAEAAGVGVSTIKNVERGVRQPRPSTLQLLAEALGCRAEELQQGRRLPSVAVLPFKNLSSDEDQDYFCEGLAEELINALVHVRGLRVAARTSSFHFKEQRDLRAIGDALHVDTVLEGSVRVDGKRLRITAQLIQVEDGFHLWSEQFDRKTGDVFAIQQEISQAIVARLRVELAAGEQEKLTKRHTVDEKTHLLYLKGLYFWHRRFEGALKKALIYFQQALDRDPVHAPAYVGIAGCYIALGTWQWRPCREVMPKARLAAERALEIDDTLADAHAARAMVTFSYDWDWPAAEPQFRHAIELNPRSAMTRVWYSFALGEMERIDEALAEAEHAQALDPLSPFVSWAVATQLYIARRYDDALERHNAILEVEPRFVLATMTVGWIQLTMGNYEAAIANLEDFVEQAGESGLALEMLGRAYAAGGQRDRALAVLDRMHAISPDRWIGPNNFAGVHAGLGDGEKLLAYGAAACEGREAVMLGIRINPVFDVHRHESWWHELERMVGIWD